MAQKSPILRIAALLHDPATEKQVAAAIVLGELGARDADVLSGLIGLVDSGVGPLQRAAVDALGRLGAKKALPKALPLLAARDDDVRAAAVRAVVAFGADAVPALRARLPQAEPAEKRALEEALGRLGGKDAFAALLSGLDSDDVEAAKAATLAVRQRVKDADARARGAYLGQVERFLAQKRTKASPPAAAAALKIMGFLEDERAMPKLLAYAASNRHPDVVRQEAVIALRFAFGKVKPAAAGKLAGKLLGIAEAAPLPVARAALYTLASVPLTPELGKRLARLAGHRESERALLAIERMAQLPGAAISDALGRILMSAADRARAEAAAGALASRPEAGGSLARAMCDAGDSDRAGLLGRMLRPMAGNLDRRHVRAIRDQGLRRLADGKPGWEPFLQVAREADAAPVADSLRDLAARLRRGKQLDRALAVLRALGRSAEATPDDGYALGALELAAGRRDEALTVFGQLADRGFDVAAGLRKDRALDDQQRYVVGFHLVERGHPAGEEILTDVAAGGRSKIAKMAKAKLRSAGLLE